MESSATATANATATAGNAATADAQVSEERLKEEFFKFFSESEVMDLVFEDDEE